VSRRPVSRAIVGGSATPGSTSVSKVSAISSDRIDELRVLDERLGRLAVRKPDTASEPRQARVTLDHIREERVGQRRRGALEGEEDACRLLGPDSAAARVNELDEAVGGIERQLHVAPP
jgi:hypothetical protein